MFTNVVFDSNVFINARKYLIEKNEQVQFGEGSPFIPVIANATLSSPQEAVQKYADEIDDIGDVDREIIATCKLFPAVLVSFDKSMLLQSRSHKVRTKALKTNFGAYNEIKKIKNRYNLVVPECQIHELQKYGVL